eukprot:TRINITY_DN39919_c0_g1_i1.p1 TRINITY_DN39919_c0_g1~~TRINITY_DN39919_c0_g1_i1.p1  ORF type:complete len:587 (+),score=85.17 TRINITY_DN39919_c0_g1_i1:74-1834(+)
MVPSGQKPIEMNGDDGKHCSECQEFGGTGLPAFQQVGKVSARREAPNSAKEMISLIGDHAQNMEWRKVLDLLSLLAGRFPVVEHFYEVPLEKGGCLSHTLLMMAAQQINLAMCKMLVWYFGARRGTEIPPGKSAAASPSGIWEVELKDWMRLTEEQEEMLNRAKQSGDTILDHVVTTDKARKYVFDLVRMTQTRVDTEKVRPIRFVECAPSPVVAVNLATDKEVVAFLSSPEEVLPKFGRPMRIADGDFIFDLEVLRHRQDLEPDVTGVNSVFIFEDPSRTRWLFKPMRKFLGHLEVSCSKLQRMLGIPSPEIFLLSADEVQLLQGMKEATAPKGGTLQRMFGSKLEPGLHVRILDDLGKCAGHGIIRGRTGTGEYEVDMDGSAVLKDRRKLIIPGVNICEEAFGGSFDPLKLDPLATEWLQRHEVFDWLIANSDSHEGQFVRLNGEFDPSLTLLAIDKGRAFKKWWVLFKQGRHREGPFRPEVGHATIPIYKTTRRLLQEGKYPQGWADLRKLGTGDEAAARFDLFLRRVTELNDDLLVELFKPYIMGSPSKDDAHGFFTGLLKHKNSMRDQFHAFHQSLSPHTA